MGISTTEDEFLPDEDREELAVNIDEPRKRGRPTKKLYWRKIEEYWEEQRLKNDLEDIFFQTTDAE